MTTLGIFGPFQLAIIVLIYIAIPVAIIVLVMKTLRKRRAETTSCPYCGERIMAAAQKCRHCGEWLDRAC